tara:strand:+ start:1780 stop:2328 length:549 start_codon:yes stop_codon:yes gene_type:complete
VTRKRKNRKIPITKSQFNPPNIFIFGLSLVIAIALFSAVDKIFYSNDKIEFNENTDIASLLTVSQYEKTYGEKISIQILNGCGAKGLAEDYSVFLIKEGHNVIEKENASNHDFKKTEIIIRNSNRLAAYNIAELIGISEKNISADPNPNLQCDLTLIIGKDYMDLPSHSKMLNAIPTFELSK